MSTRFGNLITSLPTGWLAGSGIRVRLKVGRKVHGLARLVRTYADLRKGELGLLGSSFGVLEVAVREGRAADWFRAWASVDRSTSTSPERSIAGEAARIRRHTSPCSTHPRPGGRPRTRPRGRTEQRKETVVIPLTRRRNHLPRARVPPNEGDSGLGQ